MSAMGAVFRREFSAYFATPIAFVFLIIFLFSIGIFTFYIGNFYNNGAADLSVFFGFHPWLYLFLIPALAMRLWAEEKRSGSIELLLTLPLPVWATKPLRRSIRRCAPTISSVISSSGMA